MLKPEQVQAMTDINIPREAVEAAARAMCCTGGECQMTKRTCNSYLLDLDARKAISAGLKAWPNAWINCDLEKFRQPATHLILPLPATENTNAET